MSEHDHKTDSRIRDLEIMVSVLIDKVVELRDANNNRLIRCAVDLAIASGEPGQLTKYYNKVKKLSEG